MSSTDTRALADVKPSVTEIVDVGRTIANSIVEKTRTAGLEERPQQQARGGQHPSVAPALMIIVGLDVLLTILL